MERWVVTARQIGPAARRLLHSQRHGQTLRSLSQLGTKVCSGVARVRGASPSMKHAASRELYAYWDEKRGTRRAPERAEIEPGAIRGVLSVAFILALDRAAGHPVRLAGTRICALSAARSKANRSSTSGTPPAGTLSRVWCPSCPTNAPVPLPGFRPRMTIAKDRP